MGCGVSTISPVHEPQLGAIGHTLPPRVAFQETSTKTRERDVRSSPPSTQDISTVPKLPSLAGKGRIKTSATSIHTGTAATVILPSASHLQSVEAEAGLHTSHDIARNLAPVHRH